MTKRSERRAIRLDLAERHIVACPRGDKPARPFGPTHLRNMLRNPAYRGVRRFEGDDIIGDWPAIVSESVWLGAQRILSEPARTTRRPGGQKWLLSLLARCDACGGPLATKFRSAGRRYICQNGGCVAVAADERQGRRDSCPASRPGRGR